MDARVIQPLSRQECVAAALAGPPSVPRGLGRSYGDSALADRVVDMRRLDHLVAFDPSSGTIECESGTCLADIVEVVAPHGWFLPVTPGTRHVTIGGAIASDVHGKNHHCAGTFGSHLRHITVLTGDGCVVRASPAENADLFRATCGGMGLTGVILSATLQLKRVPGQAIDKVTLRVPGVEAMLDAFDASAASTYSVAWIDCLARGASLGRGVVMLGEHTEGGCEPMGSGWSVPVDAPEWLLNRGTAQAFNSMYFHRAARSPRSAKVAQERFFYPLDAIGQWNRLYGKQGFLQYQCVLPQAAGREPLRELLQRIAQSGQASFLGVLKRLGPANGNLLSFPIAGWTLALDFKADAPALALLDSLDALVHGNGGRVYLAKDARMSATSFRRGYPSWEEFESVRERWHAHGRFSSAQSRRLGLL